MFDELADHFQEITDAGHLGVILSLGQTCKRLAARQGSFVQVGRIVIFTTILLVFQ